MSSLFDRRLRLARFSILFLLPFEFLDDFLQGHVAVQNCIAGIVATDELSVDAFIVRRYPSDHHICSAVRALRAFVLIKNSWRSITVSLSVEHDSSRGFRQDELISSKRFRDVVVRHVAEDLRCPLDSLYPVGEFFLCQYFHVDPFYASAAGQQPDNF